MKKYLFLFSFIFLFQIVYSQNILTRQYKGIKYKSVLLGHDSNMYLMDSKMKDILVIDKNGITINSKTIDLVNLAIGNAIETTDSSVLVFKKFANGQYGIVEYDAELNNMIVRKTFAVDSFFTSIDGDLYFSRIDGSHYIIAADMLPNQADLVRVLNSNFNSIYTFQNSLKNKPKVLTHNNKIYNYGSNNFLIVIDYVNQISNYNNLSFSGSNSVSDYCIQDGFLYFLSSTQFYTYLTKLDLNNNSIIYSTPSFRITSSLSPRFINVSNQNIIGVTSGSVIYKYDKLNGQFIDSTLFLKSTLNVTYVNTKNDKNVTLNTLKNTTDDNVILTVFDKDLNYQECNLGREPICYVSFDKSTGKNKINWQTSDAIEYNVYKEKSVAGQYELLFNTSNKLIDSFIDTSSNPSQQSYRYVLTAKYECGVTTPYSIPHKTIHLTASPSTTGGVNLIWSGYSGFNIGTYYIYRGSQPNNMILIDSIQSSLNSYSDLQTQPNQIYYEIRARKYGDCSFNTYYKTNTFIELVSNVATNMITKIDYYNESKINFYPNPTSNYIVINGLPLNDLCKIEIYDTFGKLILFQHVKENGVIDLSELNSGIYILKAKNTSVKILKF